MPSSDIPEIAAIQQKIDAKRREVQKAEDENRTADSIRLAAEWQALVNERESISQAHGRDGHNRKRK